MINGTLLRDYVSTEAIEELLFQAEILSVRNLKETEDLLLRAISLADESGYIKGKVNALIKLSTLNIEVGKFTVALSNIKEAEALIQEHGLKENFQATLFYTLAGYYNHLGNYNEALANYEIALQMSERLDSLELKYKCITSIATIYYLIGDYEKSLEFLQNATEYFESINETNRLSALYNNVGCCFVKLNKLDLATVNLQRSILCAKEINNKNVEAISLDELAQVELLKNNRKTAYDLFNEAIQILSGSEYLFSEVGVRLSYATALVSHKNYQEAKIQSAKIEQLMKNIDAIDLKMEFYQLLAEINEGEKNYLQALNAYKKYHEYELQLKKDEVKKNLSLFETERIMKMHNTIKSLSEIGKEITSILDLEDLLNHVYKHINNFIDANIVGIALFNENQKISYEFFLENGVRMPNTYINMDDDFCLGSWAIKNNKDVIINNFEKDIYKYFEHEQFPKDLLKIQKSKSLIFFPLRFKEEIIGILTIQSANKYCFTVEDLDSLRVIVSYFTIALKNASQAVLIKKQNERLYQLVNIDDLTNLYNRRYFNNYLNKAWNEVKSEGKFIALILIDLDDFKKINDDYGHFAGDEILRLVSNKLLTHRLNESKACRIGGEEFAIIIKDISSFEALHFAEQLRMAIESITYVSQEIIKVTASIGVCIGKPSIHFNDTSEALFTRVDKGLYKAKYKGKNKVEYYE